MTLPRELHTAFAAWDLGPILASAIPAAGTVNETMLVTTARGRYAVRGYRHPNRQPIEREHAIIAHVRAQRLPAIGPLPLPATTETILEHNGRFVAVFPHAAGHQRDKADLTPSNAAAMGRTLAHLHRALRSLPPELGFHRTLRADRSVTLARIALIEAVIRSRQPADPIDTVVLQRLAAQQHAVEALPEEATINFGNLPVQVIHGDYQGTNLFFDANGKVSAVIDWDQTYLAPAAWEIARTLHLSFNFAPALSISFLAAYHAENPLPSNELDQAMAAYDVKSRHDLWTCEAFYLDGNARVRRFLQSPEFIPVADQWALVRPLWLASSPAINAH